MPKNVEFTEEEWLDIEKAGKRAFLAGLASQVSILAVVALSANTVVAQYSIYAIAALVITGFAGIVVGLCRRD